MNKDYKIKIVHDDTGDIVKILEYSTKAQQEKAYIGVINRINLDQYSAHIEDKE